MKTPFTLLACLLVIAGAKKKSQCIDDVVDIWRKEDCGQLCNDTPMTEDCINCFLKHDDLDPVCTEDTLKRQCEKNVIEVKEMMDTIDTTYYFSFACDEKWREDQIAGAKMNKMKKICDEEKIVEIIRGDDCEQQCSLPDTKDCSSCVMKHQDFDPACKENTLKKQCKQSTKLLKKFRLMRNFELACMTMWGIRELDVTCIYC